MTKKTNREEEDRENFRKYNIFFRRPASESEFPAHHKISFDKILELGRTRFQTYCQNDDETSSFWRAETKGHAQHLVETTSRLARNRASEMKWRLDLEKIVYKRFELEIDWYLVRSLLRDMSNFKKPRACLPTSLVEI